MVQTDSDSNRIWFNQTLVQIDFGSNRQVKAAAGGHMFVGMKGSSCSRGVGGL